MGDGPDEDGVEARARLAREERNFQAPAAAAAKARAKAPALTGHEDHGLD
jgi:hypothetical protein